MKIYIIGNCQSFSLAACVSAMNPRVEVERLPIAVDVGSIGTDDDLIFRQRNPRVAWTLRPARHNEILYPRLWFNAFHPDLVYIASPRGAAAPPFGAYHSSLVLYAWHRGLSASQTARLFCEAVFEKLHFFRYWDGAKRALLAEGEGVGFPVDAMFHRWERMGAFMHLFDHPVLTVMADLARALAQRAGLAVTLDTPEYYLNDPLLNLTVWPIYPEIANRLGLSGSYAFKRPQPPGWVTTPDIIELDEFIERSFEAYAQMEPSELVCARLENPPYRDLESVVTVARKPTSVQEPGRGNAGGAAEWVEDERTLALERDYVLHGVDIESSHRRMESLARSSMRAPLEVALPNAMTARTFVDVRCTIKNEGDVALVTGGRHPIFLCYRWYDANGDLAEIGNSIHTSLPSPLEPSASTTLLMRIAAPQYAGCYRLRVALLQSEIAWFDDVHPGNGVEAAVDVSPKLQRTDGPRARDA